MSNGGMCNQGSVMNRKNRVKGILLFFQILCLIVAVVSVVGWIITCNTYGSRLENLEAAMNRANSVQDTESLSSKIRKNYVIDSIVPKPKSKQKIKIETPEHAYEFTDMDLTCGRFAHENNLWYLHGLDLYISPGIEDDIIILGDQDDNHWMKVHVVNTGDSDVSKSGCTMFALGIQGIEGYSINGVSVGDSIEEVVERLGTPDSFSISDYDEISGAVYDYGDYELRIIGNTIKGTVAYVEVSCKKTDGYSNGTWK